MGDFQMGFWLKKVMWDQIKQAWRIRRDGFLEVGLNQDINPFRLHEHNKNPLWRKNELIRKEWNDMTYFPQRKQRLPSSGATVQHIKSYVYSSRNEHIASSYHKPISSLFIHRQSIMHLPKFEIHQSSYYRSLSMEWFNDWCDPFFHSSFRRCNQAV